MSYHRSSPYLQKCDLLAGAIEGEDKNDDSIEVLDIDSLSPFDDEDEKHDSREVLDYHYPFSPFN